jgi:hypothetical protein
MNSPAATDQDAGLGWNPALEEIADEGLPDGLAIRLAISEALPIGALEVIRHTSVPRRLCCRIELPLRDRRERSTFRRSTQV